MISFSFPPLLIRQKPEATKYYSLLAEEHFSHADYDDSGICLFIDNNACLNGSVLGVVASTSRRQIMNVFFFFFSCVVTVLVRFHHDVLGNLEHTALLMALCICVTYSLFSAKTRKSHCILM